ncbi:endonuclease domain-containing 1 protein-like [Pithys albifrons albifrons]|uniref:endonuclease domain-containing 1 protein-like n=1 Tax=Pithys albifrons albifrons TaxID=3385563 RepID=UPI003A5D1589
MLWLLLLQVWASCLWLGHSEVGTSFHNCRKFFYQNNTPNSALNPKNPAWICQRYNNGYHYATLYDRDRRIPIYSAYTYQGERGSRPTKTWMLEPQLIDPTCPSDMQTVSTIPKDCIRQPISQSQAVNQDYDNQTCFNRGHLNPSGQHKNNSLAQIATFTLTNAVPQNSTLNRGAWRSYEQNTMPQRSKNCTKTYVIVGAVPGNTAIANGRVNVPSHIWASACCKMNNNTMSAWAVIAQNKENKVQNLTLEELETKLSRLYNRGKVSLFHKNCPRK